MTHSRQSMSCGDLGFCGMKSAPLAILHIITDLGRGGAETMLYRLVDALPRESGFVHSVISLADVGQFDLDFEFLGVPVRSLKLKAGLPSPAALLRLRRWVAAAQPDLVQGWMYHGNMAAAVAMNSKTPLVWGIHHSLQDLAREKPLTRLVIRGGPWFASRARQIVYCSQASQHQHEVVGYPATKSIFIPNGIDCERFRPDPQAVNHLRIALGLSEDALLIGHAARFHPVKNHVGLVRAFARVAQYCPTAHLLMVGRDVTLANEMLAGAVSAGGLTGRVHLLGEQADMWRILPALDVYASFSWSEAFPIVLGEAMACGVQCVTTDVGDSAVIVGDTGRVVAPGDEIALGKNIVDLLASTPAARRAIGERARARIIAEYGLSAVADRYATLYRRLSAAPK